MLNTSLHNKSARLGGPFTYEKFSETLSTAIVKEQMPNASTIKVSFNGVRLVVENDFWFFHVKRISMIVFEIMN